MSDVEIRQVHGDEFLDSALHIHGYAFEPSPPLPVRETWATYIPILGEATNFVVFEDGQPVAVAASSPLTQNIRGAIYPMGGIWGVSTHPAARRKGYARQVLNRLLCAIRAAGMPVSTLYAFKESFYERLGYTIFPQPRHAKFSPTALLPLLKRDLGGAVRMFPLKDGFERYYAYLCRQQERLHGMALFTYNEMARMSSHQHYWLGAAEVDGETVGVMTYRITGDLEHEEGTLEASRFYYASSQGRYLLLEWLARHVDQVKTVEINLPSVENPDTWLADMNVEFSSLEPPLGRVIDVAGIGGLKTGPGRFTARVHDPQCPWNEGCFTFETVDGLLQVSRADDHVDCDLGINGLAALVYGTHDPEDFALRDWGNPSPTVQVVQRTMFPAMKPHLHSHF